MFNGLLNKVLRHNRPDENAVMRKQAAELEFWRQEIERYQQWYRGELSPLYKTASPLDDQKVAAPNAKDASILTWHKLHQETKYLEDLELGATAFQGMKVLEVGAGPMPSATCFENCQLYCLEPLLPQYLHAGFPLHYYHSVTFIHGCAERIPVQNDFFDAVISVNAIDHVDDLPQTAAEIKRVLKPHGLLRMHVHYHRATTCEPIEIDDALFGRLFGWCGDLKKIRMAGSNHSIDLPANESYALWSNFESPARTAVSARSAP
jgi:SAM-dependent methyltransferase